VKVLILNQTFYPDVASTAQHASDLATGLVDAGHDVTVVCGRRAYDRAGERYSRREVWRGVQIRRIASSSFGKKARWRRAADFGTFLANCIAQLAKLPRHDVVIAMTSPPLISWLGAWFTKLKGGRFVFWVMDLNPDEALAAGWLRRDSMTTRTLTRLLGTSLQQASSIVVLDRFMARRIEEKGIDHNKISVLPPWSHDHVVRYDPAGRDAFRRGNNLDGKFVVMYSGNHSPCHPLTSLLEAAQRLRDRADIAFCFVGGGSEFDTVRAFAERHGLSNIVMRPYQPLEKLSASLSSADLHVAVMGDPFVGIVHPCKVYNIRTLGIPCLYIGPAESHISDLRPAFSVRHGDVDAIVRHIEAAAMRAASRSNQPVDTTHHGQEHVISQFIAVLEHTVATPLGVPAPQPQTAEEEVCVP
jgi:glycosyltransferase involved in cell wall biosynthesis